MLDELENDSSDSCWSSMSESSSSSSSNNDDEVYAAAFHHLFSMLEQRPKVEAYVRKTVSNYSDKEVGRLASERGEIAERPPRSSFSPLPPSLQCVPYSTGRWSGSAPTCSAPYTSLHAVAPVPSMEFTINAPKRECRFQLVKQVTRLTRKCRPLSRKKNDLQEEASALKREARKADLAVEKANFMLFRV